MSKKNKNDEERKEKMVTRTFILGYHYKLYAIENGSLTDLGELEQKEKITSAQLRKIAKEKNVKQVTYELVSTDSKLIGVPVEKFLEIGTEIFEDSESATQEE